MTRHPSPVRHTPHTMNTPADVPCPHQPAPPTDGIRWDVVERMKARIAAGDFDTPERWAVAEELLMRAAEGRE
jgi:hypothetical protein